MKVNVSFLVVLAIALLGIGLLLRQDKKKYPPIEPFGEDPRNYALQSLSEIDHATFLKNVPQDGVMNDWDSNYLTNLQGRHGYRMPRYPYEGNTIEASHPLDEGEDEYEDERRLVEKYERTERSEGRSEGEDGGEALLDVPNLRYAPYYNYTLPYMFKEGGAWPPNMSTRYANWQPGYDTAGWSWTMRPGMSYNKWPRNRWVRTNGGHFTINNGKNRAADYENAQ